MGTDINVEFINTLDLIYKAISSSKDFVDYSTKNKSSGIYMIYIDNFCDDKILPIYIGKTSNLQKRYETHYKEILSLNHLDYDTYYEYFYNNGYNFYDGHFRVCKIFKYMIDHNCELKDYKMIVLEYCDVEKLEELEQHYIKKFKSEFFGFNQLNCVSLLPLLRDSLNKEDINYLIYYLNNAMENCKQITNYINYGFTKFNYNYCLYGFTQFKTNINNKEINNLEEQLNTLLNSLRENIAEEYHKEIEKIEQQKLQLKENKDTLLQPVKTAYQKVEDAKIALRNKAKILFKNNNIYTGKLDDFINGLNNDYYKKSFNNYLKKKNITIRPYKRLEKEIQLINDLKSNAKSVMSPLQNAEDKINQEIDILDNQIYQHKQTIMSEIFPSIKFNSFALKDNVHDIQYPQVKDKYLIYVLLSNNARYKDADIIKIDCICEENIDSYYIKNRLNESIQEGCNYKEKNYYNEMPMFGAVPFNIVPEKYCCNLPYYLCRQPGYISTTVELKYGINDYTIKNKELHDFEDVIKTLKLKFGKDKYTIKYSESKNAFKTALYDFRKNKIVIKFFEI